MHGDVYKFSRDKSTMINDEVVKEPYRNTLNDIEIVYLGSASVFKSKYFQVDWNYNGRIEIYLNEYYSDLVCGLCGNSNGKKKRKN